MLMPTLEKQKSEWVIQTTEDGSEQYYYNPNTQEMRYSMPPEGLVEEEQKSSHHQPESYFTTALKENDTYERPPVRPERAANRIMNDEFGLDYHHRAQSTLPEQQQQEEEYEDDDRVSSSYIFSLLYSYILSYQLKKLLLYIASTKLDS